MAELACTAARQRRSRITRAAAQACDAACLHVARSLSLTEGRDTERILQVEVCARSDEHGARGGVAVHGCPVTEWSALHDGEIEASWGGAGGYIGEGSVVVVVVVMNH
jgi:hypothetical protein